MAPYLEWKVAVVAKWGQRNTRSKTCPRVGAALGVETTYEPGLYVVNERSIVPLNFTDKTQIQDDDDRVLNYVRGYPSLCKVLCDCMGPVQQQWE